MSTANAPSSSSEPSHRALEQAAEWFAVLDSGTASDTDRRAWQAWLAASVANRQAWTYVERITQRFSPIQASPERDTAITAYAQAGSQRLRRRQALLALGSAAVGAGLGWTAWRHTPLPDMAMAWMADHRTGTGEVRSITLPDGTRVWLNAGTTANQGFDAHVRRLDLLRGEILVDTARDPQARPFYVDTPHGRLQALGTRFTVRLDAAQTQLTVHGGAVEVRTAGNDRTLVVGAGQAVRFSGDALDAVHAADPAREAWIHGLLLARNVTLAEVVQELRRHRPGHLGLAPEIAHLRVFGGYPLGDPDQALSMLEAVLPIRVVRTFAWWVSIEPSVEAAAGR